MNSETQESGILSAIVAEATARMSGRSLERPEWERLAARAQPAPSFVAAFKGPAVGVIAEVKRKSPSAGAIKEDADAVQLARQYAEGGAAAISVLTEENHFGGSLTDLQAVARQVRLPTLRKDFIVHPIQVYEARFVGAAAILLIVRALTDEKLGELASLARDVGLETLVEVHTAADLSRAVAVAPSAIGINARDLETLVMDDTIVTALLPQVPPGIIAVAESGLKARADVERVASAGADAVLVGTVAAKSDDPSAVVRGMAGVPRTSR